MEYTYKEQCERVNRHIKELFGIYRDAVKHLEISDSEFWIWYTLIAIEGEHTQQDICSTWSLPKQTVNTVIMHLRLKKFAYLEVIPGTRNRKVIRLTEAGKKYGENLILPITKAEERAHAKTLPEELELANSIFGKYINTIREEFERIGEGQLPDGADMKR